MKKTQWYIKQVNIPPIALPQVEYMPFINSRKVLSAKHRCVFTRNYLRAMLASRLLLAHCTGSTVVTARSRF
ncbi:MULTISPECIES: hypothetical protein [Nostocales]|uniref:Uncharacterized protein n=3 Tax=Nostocales TaxID=1161 RepID=A0A8S9T090_9CYAN|nr:hypothetical protein [Tolypothrix bouteillei]KAF3885478.1 hypothetical protein DA73_0400008420 [Tolypothrix bouteillei VB521301]